MSINLKLINLYGGTTINLNHINVDFKNSYDNLICIYGKHSEIKSSFIKIQLNNHSENNYGFYLENIFFNRLVVDNTQINIQSTGNNYGFYLVDSYLKILSSHINLINEEEERNNNAIKCVSNNHQVSSNLTQDNFYNHLKIDDTQHNIITLGKSDDDDDDDIQDFIYFGFMEGQYIKIENTQYKIINLMPRKIILNKTINLKNTKSIVSLKEIIVVSVINSVLETDISTINNKLDNYKNNNCIETQDLFKYFKIDIVNSTLLGGSLNKTQNTQITLNNQQNIIYVGKDANSHYESIYDALTSINNTPNIDSNINQKYIIKIHSGLYIENKPLIFNENIVLDGLGQNASLVKLVGNSYIKLNSNVIVKNISIIVKEDSNHINILKCNESYNIVIDNIDISLSLSDRKLNNN